MSDDEDLHFIWDEAKAASNLRKHRVAFDEAARVFRDPHRLEDHDRFSREEYRYIAVGAVGGAVLTVVFTESAEGAVRIVSARKAAASERKTYEHNLFHP